MLQTALCLITVNSWAWLRYQYASLHSFKDVLFKGKTNKTGKPCVFNCSFMQFLLEAFSEILFAHYFGVMSHSFTVLVHFNTSHQHHLKKP